MKKTPIGRHRSGEGRARQRGSVYVMVLGASLIVALIGIASLMATRVQLRTVNMAKDKAQARELARAAVDRGLWEVEANPLLWRLTFASGSLSNVPLGDGTFTLGAVDPVDGNLVIGSDPVVLTGVGETGGAKYMLQVTLDSSGAVQPGSWKRVVN